MKFVRSSVFTALVLALVTVAPFARADVTFNLSTLINGNPPVGATPWLTATFQDIAAGDVRLTLTNNMPAGEFIPFLVFNSIVNPTSLTFTNNTPVSAAGTATASATQNLSGGSQVKAGLFNVQFDYQTSNSGPGRFGGGETSIWEITGSSITAANFLLTSINKLTPPTSTGGWYMAAEVRGIPAGRETTSGSIGTMTAVPEPETYAMLLAGLGLMGFVARRRKQQTV